MKKELNKKFFSNFRVWWRYCLTLFCMLLTIIPLTTSSAFGQERTTKVISLRLENATVLQALEEINRLSQNNVIFKREEVTRETQRITVDLKDVTVLQAVQECIKGTRLTCTERNGRVAVGPGTEVKSVRISGTVKDQKGAILPGVTVGSQTGENASVHDLHGRRASAGIAHVGLRVMYHHGIRILDQLHLVGIHIDTMAQQCLAS